MKLYEGMNPSFVSDLKLKKYKDKPLGSPDAGDWSNVRKMIEYLKKFYDLTCLVSGTAYVTAHLFFKEMCDIFELISDLQRHEDPEIQSMADKMKAKIGKYWLEADYLSPKMNKLIYIAAILDPRQKLRHVEKCLKRVYGDGAAEIVMDIQLSMSELFEFYKKNMIPTMNTRGSSSGSSTASRQRVEIQRRSIRRGSCSILHDSSDDEEGEEDSSELTLYFTEKKYKEPKTSNENEAVVDNFNVLKWWSTHGLRFPILSVMAKDILAIPISTVASESAFSTGGRVLDDFRSSLNPKMVEALICSEDWLRSSYKQDVEDLPEEEQEKEYEGVLKSLAAFGFGSNNFVETQTATSTMSEIESMVK